MKTILTALIKLYRKYLSPAKMSPTCRFRPTCSEYGLRAINEWGGLLGLFMTFFRILRCNPLFRGGYDPVPRRKRKTVPRTFGYICEDRFLKCVRQERMIFFTSGEIFND